MKFQYYAQNVHLTFNDEAYLQADGVAMGLSLGQILATLIMVSQERCLVPTLKHQLSYWKGSVDETTTLIKVG